MTLFPMMDMRPSAMASLYSEMLNVFTYSALPRWVIDPLPMAG